MQRGATIGSAGNGGAGGGGSIEERKPLPITVFCGATICSLVELITYLQCGVPVLVVQVVLFGVLFNQQPSASSEQQPSANSSHFTHTFNFKLYSNVLNGPFAQFLSTLILSQYQYFQNGFSRI